MADHKEIQTHCGDDDVAGVIGPGAPRRMSHIVSVRLEPDIASNLRDIANQRGVTVSDLLRKGALAIASEPNIMQITWLAPPTVLVGSGQTVTFDAGGFGNDEREELELLRAQRLTLLQMLTHIDGVGDRHNGPYPQAAWVSSDTLRDILGVN